MTQISTRRAFLIVLILLAGTVHNAIAHAPIFGPKVYVRESGTPKSVATKFLVHDSDQEYRLIVQNAEGKRGKVSSAVIELNRIRVVGPNEFNKQVDLIAKPVILLPENELVVEVRSEPGTSISVAIMGPDTPPPAPVSGVTVQPDGIPVDIPTPVTITADIAYGTKDLVPKVYIDQVAKDGAVVAIEGEMVDNGDLSLGDEIEGDGRFSLRKPYVLSEPGEVWLRVRVDNGSGTAVSDVFALSAFDPISDAEVAAMNAVQAEAANLYNALVVTKGKDGAAEEVVQYLKGIAIIGNVGVSDDTISIQYTNGIKGAILLSPPETKGAGKQFGAAVQAPEIPITASMSPASPDGHEVASKKVLVLAPFHHEFGELDSGAATRTIFDDHNETVGCPMYDVVYLEDSNAGVEAFKTIGKYGIVHVDSHGGIMWGELLVVTGTSADDLAPYQPDLVKGRLVVASVHGKQALAITPKFLAHYVGAMPSSLVFMATCKSADDPGMSDVLLAKGAQAYLGFTGLVKSKFALAKVKYFYESWVEDPVTLVTTGEVFDGACSDGACWQLAGASDLEAPSDEGLQDRSFEQATLAAWSLQGDVRVVRQLGEFAPTDGSYMALVSTGLGFVANSGSISQQTCLPIDTKTLRFDWSFTSEEFLEWCGSIYQDVFRVDLVDAGGSIANVFYREVDDLCGLVFPVEFSFDQGDAWSTGWQSEAIDISTVAAGNGGRPIALRFSAGDIGDSIYDTAVLVDRVDLER